MARLLPSLFALFLVLPFLAAPLPASAELVTCGGSAQSPCTLCDLVKGVATITDYLRDIMVFAALAIIVAMGILYIVSAGNPGMMETAKKGVFASLAGLVIILAAWIIVNTVMFVVFDAKSDLGVGASFSISGGFEFDCGASVSAASTASVSAPGPCTIAASPATPTAGSGVTLTASCSGGTPTSYAWTGSCTANGNKCIENGLTLGSHAYSVVASNAAGNATASKTVTASTAASTTYALSVSKDGSGTVTGTGINCGSDCAESYASGTNAALTASPAAGNVFASWGGACTGNAPTCTVAMTEAWTVFANFIPIPPPGTYLLAVSKDGSGTGTVTGPGISCGADCSETYTGNPTVTLTATTGANSIFEGWFGACSGTGTCSIPMTSAKSVAASFTSTVVAGGGSGGGGGMNYGDPGYGLWVPPGMPNRVVADPGGSGIMGAYIPGCLNGQFASCSSCGCALNESYSGVHLGSGKQLLLRYTTLATISEDYGIKVSAWNGGNVGVSGVGMRIWLSDNPTASYASVSEYCRGEGSGTPSITTGSETSVDKTVNAFGKLVTTTHYYCKLEPNKLYYFGIEFDEVVSGPNARFQVDAKGNFKDFYKF